MIIPLLSTFYGIHDVILRVILPPKIIWGKNNYTQFIDVTLEAQRG